MNKICDISTAIGKIKDGDAVFVSGFLLRGTPDSLLRELKSQGTKDLTVITNDSGISDANPIWVLMTSGQMKKFVSSYLGNNAASGKLYQEHPEKFEIIPQGTLAEKIRCYGAGIPGFLTPVGVDTEMDKGQQKITMGGKVCLLEESMHGDAALIHVTKADAYGNCFMRGATKNFGAIMATAADYVVVEAEEIMEVGQIDPELVTIPALFVSAVVKVGE